MVGGLALEYGRSHGVELVVFAVLFAAAMTSRFVSSGFLAAQSEAPGLAASHRSLGAAPVWERLRSAGSVRVLTYLIAMKAVTHIAAPYFTPYMLGPLDLSYGRFMTLIAASFAARVAVLPLLGRLAHHGVLEACSGWEGWESCRSPSSGWSPTTSTTSSPSSSSQASRGSRSSWRRPSRSSRGSRRATAASVLSAFNLANAAAIAIGALAGAQLFTWLDGSAAGYAWLFAVSSAGRLLTLALLRRTPAAARVPEGLQLRTLAVRPSGVAVQRPILASASSETPEAAPPRLE